MPADVRVLLRGRRECILRAAGTLATCWALAVVAVFLPLLHFILVPGLLLLGPALAWARLHEDSTLLGVDGACPACAAPLREALSQPWRERTLLRCHACSRQLTLVLAPPGPAPGSGGKLPVPGPEPRG